MRGSGSWLGRGLSAVVAVVVLAPVVEIPVAAPVAAAAALPEASAPLDSADAVDVPLSMPDGDFSDAPVVPDRSAAEAGAEAAAVADWSAVPVSSRDEFTDFYDHGSGVYTARIHEKPVNYFDEVAGEFRPIDNRVVASGGGFQNAAGPVSLFFSDDTATPEVRARSGRTAARMALRGASKSRPVVSGSRVTYPDVAADVDLEYVVEGSQLKEWVVVKRRRPNLPSSYTFEVGLENAEIRTDGNGGVVLVDEAGDPVGAIPRGAALDSAPLPSVAPVTVTPAGKGEVTVAVDRVWLEDPARVFPLRIDPTIILGRDGNVGFDAYVQAYQSGTNFNGAAQWDSGFGAYHNKVGYAFGVEFKTYQHFDTSALTHKQILGATWHAQFQQIGGAGPGQPFVIWPVEQTWNEWTVNFNNRPSHSTATNITGAMGAPGWAVYDMTSWVAQWASLQWPNHGLAIDTAGNTNPFYGFVAGEQGGVDGPYLQVTYNTLPPVSAPIAPVGGAQVMTTTPTLAATPVADGDGETVHYWYRLATGSGAETGQVINSGWLANTTSWTVPEGSLQDGVTYYWRVYTWDGHSWGGQPSDPQSFKVNLRLGQQLASVSDAAGPVAVTLANGNVTTSIGGPKLATVGGAAGVDLSYNSQARTRFGLTGRYDNLCFGGGVSGEADLTRLDSQISFDWGAGSPGPMISSDNFCARWDGYLSVPRDNTWCFRATRDDGIRVEIDDTVVIDSWFEQNTHYTQTGAQCIGLSNNRSHKIEIDYWEIGGGATIGLYVYDSATTQEFPVPADWLSPVPESLPRGWTASAGDGDALAYSEAKVAADSIVLVSPDGDTSEYRRLDSGGTPAVDNGATWAPEAGEDAVVTTTTEGTERVIVVHGADGRTYTFNGVGKLIRLVSALDDLKPAALGYTYSTDSGRLQKLVDPVSTREIVLTYSQPNGTNVCPTLSGFEDPAPGMLCKIAYWDGTTSQLYYVKANPSDAKGNLLARVVHPGALTYDLAYDAAGRLNRVRDPLAYDTVAAGLAANDDTTRTTISYDAAGRATTVTLPAPTAGSARQARTYRYVSANETQVDIAGFAPATGFARRAVHDSTGRTTADTDATNVETTYSFVSAAKDLVVSTTTAANYGTAARTSTTLYDTADRPTHTYGPAPATCYPAGSLVPSNCTGVAHTSTVYDGGINGLAATYWNNANAAGAALAHRTGVGHPTGNLNANWGTGAPAGVTADAWSARFTGDIALPAAGTYNFRFSADDGVRLWIDDKIIVDWWGSHAGFSPSGSFTSAGGAARYRIRVDYQDNGGGASIAMLWTPPGQGESEVPGASLSPRYGLVTSTTTDDTALGNPVSSQTTTTTYPNPENGLPSAVTTGGLTTTTTYETPGNGFLRRTAKTMPSGAPSTYSYYDAAPSTARYRTNPCPAGGTADQAGLPKHAYSADPDGPGPETGLVSETVYDAAGRTVASRTSTADTLTAEAWTCTTYDTRGRVVTTTIPSFGTQTAARTVTNNYAVGSDPRVSRVTDNAGSVTTTVDLLGRVTSYTDVWANTTTTSYDQAGRVTATTGPGGTHATDYDPGTGRVAAQRLDGNVLAVPTYNTVGELTTVAYPTGAGNTGNGTTGTFTLDTNTRRVTEVTWKDATNQVISSDAVTLSQAGKIVDETIDGVDANPSGPNFTYDTAGRLTSAKVAGHTLTYGFANTTTNCGTPAWLAPNAGSNTNRTSTADNGALTTSCYDHADKLRSTTDGRYTTIAYDRHGNTTTLGRQTLGYDGARRNTTITRPAVDTTAPVITSVATTTTATTATVTWVTDEPATSTVRYGTTTTDNTRSAATLTTAHSVGISGLECGTTYTYAPATADIYGNATTAPASTFTTAACTPDTTPPTITSVTATPRVDGAVITWVTDEAASTIVDHGPTTAYGSTSTDPQMVQWHSTTLTGLACATTYQARPTSSDIAASTTTGANITFTTLPCGYTTLVSANATSATTGATVTVPLTNTAPGDFALLAVTTAGKDIKSEGAAGYVQVSPGTGNDRARVTLYKKTLTAADTSATAAFSGPNGGRALSVAVYRGVEAIEHSRGERDSNTNTLSATATASAANRAVFIQSAGAQGTFTTPTGMTRQAATSAAGVTSVIDDQSPVGPGSITKTALFSTTSNLAAVLVNLRPTPTGTPPAAPQQDTTAPTITNTAAVPATTTAEMFFTTNEEATTTIEYGPTTTYGTRTISPALETSHTATLGGLACGTTHHYRIRTSDRFGNQRLGTDDTFTTSPCTGGLSTVTYTRDATDRIVAQNADGQTTRYGHSAAGDTSDFTQNTSGTVLEKTVATIGGVIVTRRTPTTLDLWSYPNIHGDITATADTTGTKTGTHTYDPYGQPLHNLGPDNTTGTLDNGWLGSKQRATETAAGGGIIQMGARPYLPGIGRFLQIDSVEGGSANDYDYADADPVNQLDLTGLFCVTGKENGKCRSWGKVPAAVRRTYRKGSITIQGCHVACVGVSFSAGRNPLRSAQVVRGCCSSPGLSATWSPDFNPRKHTDFTMGGCAAVCGGLSETFGSRKATPVIGFGARGAWYGLWEYTTPRQR